MLPVNVVRCPGFHRTAVSLKDGCPCLSIVVNESDLSAANAYVQTNPFDTHLVVPHPIPDGTRYVHENHVSIPREFNH